MAGRPAVGPEAASPRKEEGGRRKDEPDRRLSSSFRLHPSSFRGPVYAPPGPDDTPRPAPPPGDERLESGHLRCCGEKENQGPPAPGGREENRTRAASVCIRSSPSRSAARSRLPGRGRTRCSPTTR